MILILIFRKMTYIWQHYTLKREYLKRYIEFVGLYCASSCIRIHITFFLKIHHPINLIIESPSCACTAFTQTFLLRLSINKVNLEIVLARQFQKCQQQTYKP